MRIKTRFHIFFCLFLGALLFRTYFYVALRMTELEDIKGLENWDLVPPNLVYLMGLEEFAQNFVLLCYFFGVNDQMSEEGGS
jgi:hypothetical protein